MLHSVIKNNARFTEAHLDDCMTDAERIALVNAVD